MYACIHDRFDVNMTTHYVQQYSGIAGQYYSRTNPVSEISGHHFCLRKVSVSTIRVMKKHAIAVETYSGRKSKDRLDKTN